MNRIARGRQHTASKRWLAAAVLALVQAHAAFAGISFIGAEPIDVAPNPEYMVAGDLTGDGLSDVVVVSPESTEVDVFLASPDSPSRFAAAHRLFFGSALRGPALADLNADGHLDLAVADASARALWVLLGNGGGSFTEPYAINVPGARYLSSVAVGNFDDAGHPDLAVADERLGRVFLLRNDNGAPPCFVSGGDFAVGERPTQIATADLDGDGQEDIITLNRRASLERDVAVALWKGVNRGVPEFESATPYGVGEGPKTMVIADFTRDGRPDVATISSGADGNIDQITVLVNGGAGASLSPAVTPLPCPFFTYGEPCRFLALTGGDFDGNGAVDLAVAFADPRRRVSPANGQRDAMELLSGRGDGQFVHGPVIAIQKAPLSMITGMIAGTDGLDIVIADARTLSLQAFLNRSGPGILANGEPCTLDQECLSSHCINGVCCVTECDAQLNEVCNIPGREGQCTPLTDAAPCVADDRVCPEGWSCVDRLCCDQPCENGRCNVDGLWGICIPGIPDGEACYGDDASCTSGHCGPNLVCCREDCPDGYCDSVGLCRGLRPADDPCREDAECQSHVCDPFEGVCCDRRCADMEACTNGVCRPSSHLSQHVAAASLVEVNGTAGPLSNPCDSCPSGSHRSDGVCVGDDHGSGCSTVGGDSPAKALPIGMLLVALLWISRRRQRGPWRAAGKTARWDSSRRATRGRVGRCR